MDKLRKTSNIPPTTLSASISDSDTTIPLSSTVGAETSTYIDIVIDRIDAAGEKTPDKMEVVTVLISGNNGTNAIRGRTAPAMPHEQGAVVEYNISTSVLHNDLIDGVSSILTSEGKPKEKAIPLSSVNGGTKGGVLIVDSDGDVTVGKTTADNIDFTTMPYMAKTTAGTDGQVIGGNTLATAAFRRVIASKGDIEATTNGVKIKKPGWYSVVGAASFGDAPNSNTFIRVAVKSESESGEIRLITPFERLVVGEIWRGISINMNLKLEVGDIVLLEVQNAHSASTRLSSMNEDRRIYQYSLSVTMLNSD